MSESTAAGGLVNKAAWGGVYISGWQTPGCLRHFGRRDHFIPVGGAFLLNLRVADLAIVSYSGVAPEASITRFHLVISA